MQAVIELYQAVKQAIDGPDVVLGACKSRVQRSDRILLVVAEGSAGVGWFGLVAGPDTEKYYDANTWLYAQTFAHFIDLSGQNSAFYRFNLMIMPVISPGWHIPCSYTSIL